MVHGRARDRDRSHLVILGYETGVVVPGHPREQ
jgi:hypothetical protein